MELLKFISLLVLFHLAQWILNEATHVCRYMVGFLPQRTINTYFIFSSSKEWKYSMWKSRQHLILKHTWLSMVNIFFDSTREKGKYLVGGLYSLSFLDMQWSKSTNEVYWALWLPSQDSSFPMLLTTFLKPSYAPSLGKKGPVSTEVLISILQVPLSIHF